MPAFRVIVTVGWGLVLLNGATAAESPTPAVEVSEAGYNFDIVGVAQQVEHTFFFRNNTSEILHPSRVAVTKPLVFDAVSPRVDPGDEGFVRVHLGTPRPLGPFEGEVEVSFRNSGVSNLVFEVTGYVRPYIEVAPIPAFFVSVQRGKTNEASLQLINHEPTPLQILAIEHTSSRFTTRLLANEPGQRYTLTLALRGEGHSGPLAEKIRLRTSSLRQPILTIGANTLVKERVYTFPQDVDFKSVDLTELRKKPALTNLVTQTLMVYQQGGTNFDLTAKISLPFLHVEAEPARSHDRWQITIRPDLDQMTPGSFEGMLVVQTNDPEFSWLNVPVHITVSEVSRPEPSGHASTGSAASYRPAD
jgi:hypothetical protein